MSPSRSALVMLLVTVLACTGATIGFAWRATPQTQSTSAATTQDDVPKSCPITKPPVHPFVPPYPAEFYPGYFWFGTEKLWINLPADGTWKLGHYNPSETAFRQKLLWWHKGFERLNDSEPILKVAGKRLDSPAPTFEEEESASTYGGANSQFIVVGLDIPTLGCWKITGRFGTAEVSFVIWVTPK